MNCNWHKLYLGLIPLPDHAVVFHFLYSTYTFRKTMLFNLDPTNFILFLTFVLALTAFSTIILTIIICCVGKKQLASGVDGGEAPPPTGYKILFQIIFIFVLWFFIIPDGESAAASEGGESKGKKDKKNASSSKKGKVEMDTVPKGEYGTLRGIGPGNREFFSLYA